MNKPSLWYWIICVIGLVWNCGGAFDFIMTLTENEAYLSQIPEETMDYYRSLPGWLVIPWALAVWGGFLGWLMMLLRQRWAVSLFIASFVGMAVNFGYWIFTGGLSLMPQAAVIMTGAIMVFAAFAIWYSREHKNKGTLR